MSNIENNNKKVINRDGFYKPVSQKEKNKDDNKTFMLASYLWLFGANGFFTKRTAFTVVMAGGGFFIWACIYMVVNSEFTMILLRVALCIVIVVAYFGKCFKAQEKDKDVIDDGEEIVVESQIEKNIIKEAKIKETPVQAVVIETTVDDEGEGLLIYVSNLGIENSVDKKDTYSMYATITNMSTDIIYTNFLVRVKFEGDEGVISTQKFNVLTDETIEPGESKQFEVECRVKGAATNYGIKVLSADEVKSDILED